MYKDILLGLDQERFLWKVTCELNLETVKIEKNKHGTLKRKMNKGLQRRRDMACEELNESSKMK